MSNLEQIATYNPAICPNKCGRKFGGRGRKANLKLHLSRECGMLVNCPLCPKTFIQRRSLKYHMGTFHKMINLFDNSN